MRIRTSDNYYHDYGCKVDDCERLYCQAHRMLWRFCDTAKTGTDGEYSDGRNHIVYEWGDCPECEKEYRKKKPTEEARYA